jgi:integral membrane sensor domain MASE1
MKSKPIKPGQAAQVLGLGLTVFALAWLSIELSSPWRRLPPIWLPNAVIVAVLLRTEVRRWPALLGAALLGNMSAGLVRGDAPASALGLSAANFVEVALCVLGVVRVLKGRINVERPAQILIFGCIAAASASVGAIVGSVWLSAINHVEPTTNWLLWTLADSLGLVLLTPFLASVQISDFNLLQSPTHTRRAAAVLAAIVVDIALAAILPAHSLPLLAPPLMVFATLQMDFLGAAVSTLAVAVAFSVFIGRGWIPAAMSGRDFANQLVAVQMFLMGTSITTFPLAATLQRRKALERDLIASRDALVEANRQARMAEKLAGVGYWRLAPGGERFSWSEEMYRIYGRDPALGPPTVAESIALVHPDDREALNHHRRLFITRAYRARGPAIRRSAVRHHPQPGRTRRGWRVGGAVWHLLRRDRTRAGPGRLPP